jgi:selenocysteine-specific elongation factor
MHVIATAGHVDHGKSTLVRALTGMEPDRLEEERRRGLTIELGFVWASFEEAAEPIAFVDVPGHHRFLSTMLAGVGPVPAAMLVVAADGGWEAQTAEHVAALSALGVRHGLVAITRSDLADPERVRADVLARLADTSFGGPGLEAIAVSGRTGDGLPDLRAALGRLTAALPAPERTGRIRLWVDRAFTIGGAGTVITGTLGSGTLRVGDDLELAGPDGVRQVRVRGLQSLEHTEKEVGGVARVAVNLRGIPVADVSRGDALLTPGADLLTPVVDVTCEISPEELDALPAELVFHFGAASVPVRLRPLAEGFARLTLDWALPLRRGDRALLRDPGRHTVAAAVVVADVDPPELARRGAARERGAVLDRGLDLVAEVSRRGAVQRSVLDRLGLLAASAPLPGGLREVRARVVTDQDWARWVTDLRSIIDAARAADPLSQGLAPAEAAQRAGIPAAELIEPLAREAKLQVQGGRISGAAALPPAAQAAVDGLIARLRANPFDAPEAGELAAAGITQQVLAAAERHGLLLRLSGNTGPVVLLPDAPEEAVQRLATLPSPFTVSDARGALGASRRIAVPLLEHLDATRRTRRIDSTGRTLL